MQSRELLIGVLLILFNNTLLADSPDKISNVVLADMSLEELLNIRVVTSAGKKEQKIKDASAAIFVITQDDIHHSGATHIADLLRMVPGLQIARYNAHSWAVTSRGFNGYYANKLLVLMDGRTLYTPEFSGVYWDVVDTMLEDIERIEVIRGPGGTLWGANAVNGVINIITKSARDTQGRLIVAGGGKEEKGFARARYGTAINENTYIRAYAKTSRHDAFPGGFYTDFTDDWNFHQAGIRTDGKFSATDQWTIQGDIYSSEQKESNYRLGIPGQLNVHGNNLLGRWQHKVAEDSQFSLQLFYDYYKRGVIHQPFANTTYDLEAQHRFKPTSNHDVVWGVGYRRQVSDIPDIPLRVSYASHYNQSTRHSNLYNLFLQDDIKLLPDTLTVTIGTKLERNDYTGWEVQPNIRFSWLPTAKSSFWAAVSRAVRTPSRDNRDSKTDILLFLNPSLNPFYPTPIKLSFAGNSEAVSEKLVAYELGMRTQVTPNLSVDVTAFYNDYDKLMLYNSSINVTNNQLVLQEVVNNGMYGNSHGVELSTEWAPTEKWRLSTAYTYFDMRLYTRPGIDPDGKRIEDLSPRHQISLRSHTKLPYGIEANVWLRHVTKLNQPIGKYGDGGKVPAYNALDLHLAWQLSKNLELSIVGQNLLKKQHMESPVDPYNPLVTKIQRSIYGAVQWQF